MRYYLIAGEASGDLHGSNLIKGLESQDPEAVFRFWGGDMMLNAAGRKGLVHHYREGAVMGVSDVLKKAGKLLRNVSDCEDDISSWQPDVVILIDYPGFNFKIAEYAHNHGLRVFYYIAPKTWASRENRNAKLKKYVDRLFIVFPFEKEYFDKKGISYIYAGNPLLDAVDNHQYEPVCDGPSIAVLAGSRNGEISRMMPVCMDVVDRLSSKPEFKDYKFVIAGAPSRSEADYRRHIGDRKNVLLVFGRTYDVLRQSDAAIINSGTASLEAALIGTPQVVCWSTSKLTAFVARNILHVMDHIRYISLGNLIIDRLAFKELVQEDFTADNVCQEVRLLVLDREYRMKMLADYSDIRSILGSKGASKSVAKAMMTELKILNQ